MNETLQEKMAAFVELTGATIADLHETVQVAGATKAAAVKAAAEVIRYVREAKLVDANVVPQVETKMASYDGAVDLVHTLFRKVAEQRQQLHDLASKNAEAIGSPAKIPGSAPAELTTGDVARQWISKR